jgi:hypothetical protein
MLRKTTLWIFVMVFEFLLPGADFAYGGWHKQWLERTKLLASDDATWDRFGHSVSISDNYVIVGALGDDNYNGLAYVFEFNGTDWRNR